MKKNINKAITTGTTLLLHLAAPDVAAGRGGMHAKDAHTVGVADGRARATSSTCTPQPTPSPDDHLEFMQLETHNTEQESHAVTRSEDSDAPQSSEQGGSPAGKTKVTGGVSFSARHTHAQKGREELVSGARSCV